ncbi:MAG: ATP synthase F1 subunit gamma [Patescibacteria group bacterium]|nr:ATP synthase F1 subunit gamma [Patescibacteria group bacterium]
MPGIKELKTRIKSIQGTRKVTRAMQLVSAAKMRKAQDATLKSRTYSTLAWELILNLAGQANASVAEGLEAADDNILNEEDRRHSLMEQVAQLLTTFPDAKKIAILILSTNRGMVGGLNTNLLGEVEKICKDTSLEVDMITCGRKAREWMVRGHKQILADFEKFDRSITPQDIFPIAKLVRDIYNTGQYQKVLIVYNHFVSTLSQEPRVKQLLPFGRSLTDDRDAKSKQPAKDEQLTDYLFEPDPQAVLNHLLPRIIESQIYQTILESEASEQSARMVMMKNATEAAGDLISDLTLTFNKLRQNKITTELAEITAGKIALE